MVTETEHIVLNSGLSPEDTTIKLAEILGAEVARPSTGIVWTRRVTSDEDRVLVGRVRLNEYGRAPLGPGYESIYDNYALILEMWTSGKTDEELLHTEAGRVFDEITERLPWPAAHTHIGGLLYAAWAPGLGRTDFPPNTGYDDEDRHLWERYAQPTTS